MATEQDHVWAMLDDMLVFLSKRHVPTPERTYKLDGGWTLAMDDLRRFVDNLIAERDQLRAELAAAKDLLARIHRDGGHHTEAVGVAQSVADADNKVSEWLLAAEDRNALAADNARLRKALELWQRIPFAFEEFGDRGELVVFSPVYYHNSMSVTRDALAATTTQSLASHDAALLERVKARLYALASKEADQPYGYDLNPRQWAAEWAARMLSEARQDECRKEFMCQQGCYMWHDIDHESCWLVWPHGKDGEGQIESQPERYATHNAAIDAAMKEAQ